MDTQTRYRITTGLVADRPNANGRLYSKELIENIAANAVGKMGEMQPGGCRPQHAVIERPIFVVRAMDIDDRGELFGSISFTDWPNAQNVRTLVEAVVAEGGSLQLALRGLGRVEADGTVRELQVTGFDLVCMAQNGERL